MFGLATRMRRGPLLLGSKLAHAPSMTGGRQGKQPRWSGGGRFKVWRELTKGAEATEVTLGRRHVREGL